RDLHSFPTRRSSDLVVIWTLGTLTLFDYKITLLSGLIPPVIVTIGITNAIYLLNKYHVEFARTKNKEEAIRTVVLKMGLATFLRSEEHTSELQSREN